MTRVKPVSTDLPRRPRAALPPRATAAFSVLLLLLPACGTPPLLPGLTSEPAAPPVTLSVVNEASLFGALTYVVSDSSYDERRASTLRFAMKGQQPWGPGFDSTFLVDLSGDEGITFISVAFEEPVPGIAPPTDVPGPQFDIPDVPGKRLVRGVDFDAGDTIVVTVYLDRIVVSVERGAM